MRKFTIILSAAIVALTTAVTTSPAQATSYKVAASISTASAQSGDGPYMRGTLKPPTRARVSICSGTTALIGIRARP